MITLHVLQGKSKYLVKECVFRFTENHIFQTQLILLPAINLHKMFEFLKIIYLKGKIKIYLKDERKLYIKILNIEVYVLYIMLCTNVLSVIVYINIQART